MGDSASRVGRGANRCRRPNRGLAPIFRIAYRAVLGRCLVWRVDSAGQGVGRIEGHAAHVWGNWWARRSRWLAGFSCLCVDERPPVGTRAGIPIPSTRTRIHGRALDGGGPDQGGRTGVRRVLLEQRLQGASSMRLSSRTRLQRRPTRQKRCRRRRW